MSQPKITIVTVTYNAVQTIEETILSVINQDYPNIEYIIVDGGSSDGTVDIIKKYQDYIAKWVSEPDNGLYHAMNKGLLMGTGEWINFRNSGDYFASKNAVTSLFNEVIDDDVMIVHADCYKVYENGYKLSKPLELAKYKWQMPLIHPATFVKMKLHQQMPFNLKYKVAADYDLIYKCIEKGVKFKYIPTPIVVFPSGGFSDTNWKIAISDMLTIQGYTHSLYGKLLYALRYSYIWVHMLFFKCIGKKESYGSRHNLFPLPLPLEKYY